MKNTKVLQMLTEGKIEELALLLRQEIASEKAPNKSIYTARVKLSKIAYKDGIKNCREKLGGAYEFNGKQCICNGYFGVMYNDIASGLLEVDSKYKNDLCDIERIFPTNTDGYSCIDIDWQQVINDDKIAKAEKKDHYISCKNATGEKVYLPAEQVINVMASLENPKLLVKEKMTPAIIEAKNGKAIICPIRYENACENHIITNF